jgi:RNA polymerase sigma-70 factor (ECF subfamily)
MDDSVAGMYAAFSAADSQETLEQQVSALFVEMRDGVYRYLLFSVGDSCDAEDLTQEVFLRLYKTLRQRRRVENVRAWLLRVAHNLAVDWQQEQSGRRRTRNVDARAPDRADPSASAEQSLLRVEESRRIERAVARLSGQERRCLELRAEGLRYREIAEILGIGIPSVQTFLARAVRKLAGGDNA